MTPPAAMPGDRRVILDTDIGSDVDDALALAVLLGSPEVDLIGCTTVYGDALLRARLTKRLVRLAGRQVTVVPGADATLTGRPVWWAGHEGALFDDLEKERVDDAVDATRFLVDQVAAAPGGIDVVAIGPLTNIANAINADPGFAGRIRHLWIMGGRFDDARPEHNFASDPEAAQVVFGSGAPITVTGLEITNTVHLDAEDVRTIAAGGEFGRALEAEIHQWWRFWKKEWNNPHDPITVLTMLTPELFTFSEPGAVGIDLAEPAAGSSAFVPGGPGSVRITASARPQAVAEEIVRRIGTAAAPAG
jgi:purine nucleosidase